MQVSCPRLVRIERNRIGWRRDGEPRGALTDAGPGYAILSTIADDKTALIYDS